MLRLTAKESTPAYEFSVTYTLRALARYQQTRAIGKHLAVLLEKLRQSDEHLSAVLRAQIEATADRVFNDFEDDDLVREINTEAKLLDRRDPALALQKALFHEGITPVISRSGDYQLAQMKALSERLDSVKSRVPEFVDRYKPRLEAAMARTNAALTVQKDAFEATRSARSKLALVKVEIREEMEVVYGELRKHFRSSPKKAERYFTSGKTKRATLSDRSPPPTENATPAISTLQLPESQQTA